MAVVETQNFASLQVGLEYGNSVWSFVLMLLYVPIIVKRISNEEKVLEKDLVGYTEYKQRVRYGLIPLI